MAKEHTSLRIPKLTKENLALLQQEWGLNQTEIFTILVDREAQLIKQAKERQEAKQ